MLYEHFEVCSRVRALDGVRGLENTGMSRVPSILGSMASASGQTNLFHSHSCILSHYTVISPDENVKCDFYEDASPAKVGRCHLLGGSFTHPQKYLGSKISSVALLLYF